MIVLAQASGGTSLTAGILHILGVDIGFWGKFGNKKIDILIKT